MITVTMSLEEFESYKSAMASLRRLIDDPKNFIVSRQYANAFYAHTDSAHAELVKSLNDAHERIRQLEGKRKTFWW